MNGRLKRLYTAASIVYVNQVMIMLATIGVNFQVIAHLGAHRFGIYSTVLAYTSFFCIFTFSSGIDELVIKDLSRGDADRKTVDEYLTTVFLMRMALGATAFLLSCAGAYLLDYEDSVQFLILIFSLMMFFSFHRRNSLFLIIPTIYERRLLPEIVTFSITAGVLGAKIVLAAADAPLTWFVTADLLLVWGLSGVFLSVALYRGHFALRLDRFQPRLLKSLLLRSSSTALGTLFIVVFTRVDQIMLGKILNMDAVGNYSVAVQLVEGFNFIPVAASSLLLPIFSRNILKKDLMDKILAICFRSAAWTSLLIVALYWVAGESILRLIWGEQYLSSLGPLKVLAWSELFVFIGIINWAACISYGFQHLNLILIITQATLNIGLNAWLIPSHGIEGAAASTCISYSLGFFLMWLFRDLRNLAKIIFKESLPLVVIVSGLLISGQRPFQHHWVLTISTLSIVSLAVIYLNWRQASRLVNPI